MNAVPENQKNIWSVENLLMEPIVRLFTPQDISPNFRQNAFVEFCTNTFTIKFFKVDFSNLPLGVR